MQMHFLPEVSAEAATFEARHKMFRYEVPLVPERIASLLKRFDHFVILGMGGSSLPLKVFVDAARLNAQIHFIETCDPYVFEKALELPQALYCVVSKSGETFEVRLLMRELLRRKPNPDLLIVTDAEKGFLRSWCQKSIYMDLPIPADLGGRFTHFSVFHRALLERFQIDFESLRQRALARVAQLKEDPSLLRKLLGSLTSPRARSLILWTYSESLLGLSAWIQQALAESLAKLKPNGDRTPMPLPVILRGPQDQHSVLQLLMEGPQDKALWFFEYASNAGEGPFSVEGFEDLDSLSLSDGMRLLAEATYQSFAERIASASTRQNLVRFQLDPDLGDVADLVASIQALVEFVGDRWGINAFDQPGVERGKQIARELMKSWP